MAEQPLGRREPSDWKHVEKYPLSALEAATPTGVPVVLGINWYTAFDKPEQAHDGSWGIPVSPLGKIRGGHCVCLEPEAHPDPKLAYWQFYNQKQEGACVGEGWSRCQSLLNRRKYDAFWLYHEAQKVDEYSDTPPASGTSVRAGGDVLRSQGHRQVVAGKDRPADPKDGIQAFRWATSAAEVAAALDSTQVGLRGAVPILNSWGKAGYPHRVWLPLEVLDRLLSEGGEAAIPTDR